MSLANLVGLNVLNKSYVPKGTGVNKDFYENGNLKEEVNYSDGKLNGMYREFYSDGSLKSECNYLNGIIVGKLKEYYHTI